MTELTDEKFEEVMGVTAMTEYRQAPDYAQARVRAWASKLQGLTDEEFVSECAGRILDSALAMRWSGPQWEADHAMASACHTESKRRWAAAGHGEDCTGDSLYIEGYNRAYRSQGYTPRAWGACTCGVGNKPFGRAEW